jgi:hypothetical protein
MREIRAALNYAEQHFDIDRLLIRKDLKAAPGNLFLEKYGHLINLGRAGQLAMKRVLDAHLQSIEHDLEGLPCRFYPLRAEHSLAALSGGRFFRATASVRLRLPIASMQGNPLKTSRATTD